MVRGTKKRALKRSLSTSTKTSRPQTASQNQNPPTRLPQAPPSFQNLFFQNVLPEDLAALDKREQQAMADSLWHTAQIRPRGPAKVRLTNPVLEKDGWEVDHTVVEIVGDDMPFLVDSVTGELQRRHLGIHLFIHPILGIRRDEKGKVIAIQDSPAKGQTAEAESWMHIQIDRCEDPELLDDLQRELVSIIDDIRAIVEDRAAMRAKLEDIKGEILKDQKKILSKSDLEETAHFIEWLGNKNFTFLGYRKMNIAYENGDLTWDIPRKGGLGLLRNANLRLFGGLRDREKQPAKVVGFIKKRQSVIIVKTNERSRVHRTVPMDAIFIQRFDEKGKIIGEHLLVGLFTSTSYTQSSRHVPFLRDKIEKVLARANFAPDSHDGRSLIHILDNYPRDELFQLEVDDLYQHCLGIVQLQERARVALFTREDPFGRFVTCLIYVPRDRFDTHIRKKIQDYLADAFGGELLDSAVRIDDRQLARLFMTVSLGKQETRPNKKELEAGIRGICRAWADRLRDRLIAEHGEAEGLRLLRRYAEAFPTTYCNTTGADEAVRDIYSLETIRLRDRQIVDLSMAEDGAHLHIRLFQHDAPLVLSEMMPSLENMGLRVRHMNGPHEVRSQHDIRPIYIHEFVCRPALPCAIANFDVLKPLFEEALGHVWTGELENDALNSLTLRAGLSGREITILRALSRYLKQVKAPYTQERLAATLVNHPAIAYNSVMLFLTRHDPDLKGDRSKISDKIAEKITEELGKIAILEEDRIIRRFLNLIEASLRTNYFQTGEHGAHKPYLAIKFDSRAIDQMPLPKPLREIFVYSPRVEAIHLRGGKVARGGIRWSDRAEDFRTEILSLVKAQMVKNTVIVPVGSKGGFIVKRPPTDPEKFHEEGVACYQTLMKGLLDLTDNRDDDRIIPPARVVRHDGDDPYLVVAADKGTAKFSDIANAMAQKYGFWLDDAFASGGSAGYDHKGMGITARGAWESVKRHFREMGHNTQTQDFTVAGVGDLSGDVFGNGMLLSKHIRLVAAFDHRHIFLDPSPDAATSFAERQRMFNLPRSSWDDYDRTKISKGGGVFSRKDKIIKLSPEARKALGISAESLAPGDLMQAILKASVDLLYFGGIGTYIKASHEMHEEVGDRANDAIRIDATQINAKVIAEGANLGLTQNARIEFALRGGRLNTDAIDNSAGVDTSDHEVNIKILLRKLVKTGALTLPARNKFLASMTDEVGLLVLRDNILQTQALSLTETRAAELLPLHGRFIRHMEKTGLLNRAVEFLPDETALSERQRLGKGLTRPELAVLMSYAKIWLYDQILASSLPDDALLQNDLLGYFPVAMQKKYPKEIAKHQLRREIVSTVVTNDIVNRAGIGFVFEMTEKTDRAAIDIVRGYLVARSVLALPSLWDQIEKLDNKVPASAQTTMLLTLTTTLERMIPWIAAQGEKASGMGTLVTTCQGSVDKLAAWIAKNPVECTATKALIEQAVPTALAERVMGSPVLALAPDMAQLGQETGQSLDIATAVTFATAERFGLDLIQGRARQIGAESPWQREAMRALLSDMEKNHRALVKRILSQKGKNAGSKAASLLSTWEERHAGAVEAYQTLLNEARSGASFDLGLLMLLTRSFVALVD